MHLGRHVLAALVRKQVIAIFMAYRRSQLVVAQPVQAPAIPDHFNPAAARAWADQYEQRQIAKETVRVKLVVLA